MSLLSDLVSGYIVLLAPTNELPTWTRSQVQVVSCIFSFNTVFMDNGLLALNTVQTCLLVLFYLSNGRLCGKEGSAVLLALPSASSF